MIINNSNFLIDIENYHPLTQKYQRIGYWSTQVRRCIEGYWSSGKWMPGPLYFYVNFFNINRENKNSGGLVLGKPDLSDLEWEDAYYYTEACGFSGFAGDPTHTCDRKFGPEKEFALKLGRVTQEEIDKVEYIDAREYLRKNHGTDLGKPLFRNHAKHIMKLSGRGLGKSYISAAYISHNFMFDGATDYDDYVIHLKLRTPLNSASVVGAEEAKYSMDLLGKVKVGLEYLPGSMEIGGRFFPSPLAPLTEGSLMPAKNFKSSTTGSLIHHRIFGEDPLSANGTRPNRAFLEEVGFLSSVVQTWGALESTQQAFEKKTLVIYALGTGGMMKGGAAMFAREVFYNPDDYNCISFDDEWENKGRICYFVPATHGLREFKQGPNKITNVPLALSYIETRREDAKKANNSIRYLTEIINSPLKPSEIFMSADSNFFPVADLKSVLADLEVSQGRLDASWKVDLEMHKEGFPEAKPSNKKPIREFPLTKNSSMDACIEVWERPKKDNNGMVPYGRYWAVNDPVDDDGNTNVRRSLQSSFIYDSWTDRLVAEYSARTYLAEEYYENLRRLVIYYNAELLYENNKKGLFAYFRSKNSLHRLLPSPEILKEQQLVKIEGITNKTLGVNMSNDKIKLFALNQYKSWMEKEAYDDEGVKNMAKIRSLGLLKETISYSPDMNCDRISAILVLMLLIADRGDKSLKQKNTSIKTASSSSFWSNAYGAKSKVFNPMVLQNQ